MLHSAWIGKITILNDSNNKIPVEYKILNEERFCFPIPMFLYKKNTT